MADKKDKKPVTKTAEEKKDAKNKPITAAVILVLVAIFVVGFIYGLNSVLAMEGSYPPNELSEGKTFLPDTNESDEKDIAAFTKQKLVDYLNGVVEAALTNEAKISTDRANGINGASITADGSDTLLSTLCFLADDAGNGDSVLGSALLADYEKKETDFGEDMSSVLRVPEITADDIEDFSITYIYYVCPACGANSRDADNECFAECPGCGSTLGYQPKYFGDYNINITLKNTDDVLNGNFTSRTDEQVKALLAEGAEGNFEIKSLSRENAKLTLSFRVDRVTDHLTYLSYGKEINVKTTVDFSDEWAELGTKNISFTFNQNDNFSLTWPGLSLDQHKMVIEPKGTDNLLATLSCSKPTEMTVTWTSSDDSVVTVDNEGYLKACKEDGKSAVITAEYEFNGKKYSDTCEVKVMYPVESTAMKKNKVTLAPGGEFQLELKFDPSNSTVQTATWYTEDEAVATVDENGVVKAVAPGVVTVYSLSDDGYFKSSCEVTVK